MSGYAVAPGALDGIASRLRTSADGLEGGAAGPPPPPLAGEITGTVTGLAGALSASLAGTTEGIGTAGDAITTSRTSYETAEQDSRDQLPAAVPDAGPH